MSASGLVSALLADLRAEQSELIALLPDNRRWDRMTPAAGWTIRDQIVHLAYFDRLARIAVEDAEAFVRERDAIPDLPTFVDSVGPAHADRTSSDLLAWWDSEARAFAAAVELADPQSRVPWFGPPMSIASKVTARLMEAWAHGQDVRDALKQPPSATDRLRHVARIGVLTFANSFASHELEVPSTPVHVDLVSPDGSQNWSWGDPMWPDSVRGTALDFSLVVTQRRHLDDVDLTIEGAIANQWMLVAQAYAGPAGEGRAPGQHQR